MGFLFPIPDVHTMHFEALGLGDASYYDVIDLVSSDKEVVEEEPTMALLAEEEEEEEDVAAWLQVTQVVFVGGVNLRGRAWMLAGEWEPHTVKAMHVDILQPHKHAY